MSYSLIATNVKSFYQPGQTILHKADPRLKLCVCLLVVVLSFAASNWLELTIPLLLVAAGLKLLAPLPSSFWRVCWMLRWLVVFTLLMHVLFTDGRTLMGVSWLSLDGFYNGFKVSLQMLLSVAAATILSLTTPVESLVAAFGWIVSPLKWLGCDTEEWQKTLLLSVNFVPVIRDEMGNLTERQNSADESESSFPPDKQSWGKSLSSFVNRLLAQGDKISHELASGEVLATPERLPALYPLTLQDRLLLIACVTMLCLYWVVGF